MPISSYDIHGHKKHLIGLDYLRGLAALCVMLFHYTAWTNQNYSELFWDKMAIYSVSIFYIVSGMTLHYVYSQNLQLKKLDLINFYTKRFFRIFPLFWLVTIYFMTVERQRPDLKIIFLNYTGLFGFLEWDKGIAFGVWSIGNEIVFYTLFPFLIWLLRKNRYSFYLVFILSFKIFGYFTFYEFDPFKIITAQWHQYYNPSHQMFIFLSGIMSAHFLQNIKLPIQISLLLIFFGIGSLMLYPVTGQSSALIYGYDRIALIGLCITICIGFYKINTSWPYFNSTLGILGKISYSMYLLHAPCFLICSNLCSKFSKVFFMIGPYQIMFYAIASTLVSSYISNKYFEDFFIRLGRKIYAKISQA
ncbi:MAG: acyltransferase [Cytophagales bacterium]